MEGKQMRTINLKPCPFCGGRAKMKEITSSYGTFYYVRCDNSDCWMYVTTCNRDTPEEAAARWNTRKDGDPNE